MSIVNQVGTLFTQDFLSVAVRKEAEYEKVDVSRLHENLKSILNDFPVDKSPSEAKTEDDLIWKVLKVLGWKHIERQVSLSPKGRDNIPDGVLFLDKHSKTEANRHSKEWKHYQHGAVLVESKRWKRPLDRVLAENNESAAPSAQMLRYLRRVDDLTFGGLRWGILTNGAIWRLYYQGARSVADQFFEIDLEALIRTAEGLHEADEQNISEDDDHWLRVFSLMFQRESFAPSSVDETTFHLRALDKGRFYEERVTRGLSDVVFSTVFPILASSIAAKRPNTDLDDVRHATLIVLYRLLFIFHAEDRGLLPVDDIRYGHYALRDKIRVEVRLQKEKGRPFSDLQDRIWAAIDSLSRAIDRGDPSIGLPPYNGGLFDCKATLILDGISIPDSVMAEVVDLLSFESRDSEHFYINYRDLSVQQLGSVYERLLEYELRRDPKNGVSVRPNSFARKASGSYYTPDSLVELILRETLDPLINDRISTFQKEFSKLAKTNIDDKEKKLRLREFDPASAILSLRICDPAMGSGHFLVSLVDYLSDTLIDVIAESASMVDWEGDPYVSPVVERVASVRSTVKTQAEENNWVLDAEQLDDRHIIRRMILKRCVYGVDKNPMAVELAKVSLWLHTFTAGAPLSFVDHHLCCGDSLFGESVGRVLKRLNLAGQEFLISDALSEASSSAQPMQDIELLMDAEIEEANKSAEIYRKIMSKTEAMNKFMQLLHAMDWLCPPRRSGNAIIQAWLDGLFGDPFEIARTGIMNVSEMNEADERGKKDGKLSPKPLTKADAIKFESLLAEALEIIEEERFLNWEIAFPGVWQEWDKERTGGFDAIIGNPPWDLYQFQEVPWLEFRDPDAPTANRKSDREKRLKYLKKKGDPLWDEFNKAEKRLKQGVSVIKHDEYSFVWNNKGRMDLYKLFVERAIQLLAPGGLVGFLVKTGIATDFGTSEFFKNHVNLKTIKIMLGFKNRKLFDDVHKSENPCVFVISNSRKFEKISCAFGLKSVDDLKNPEKRYTLSDEDFRKFNPNTKSSPKFQERRDFEIVSKIYDSKPILHLHEHNSVPRFPVIYKQMVNLNKFDDKLRTRSQLEENEGAVPVELNRFQTKNDIWLPVYEGKMVQAYDHRAAGVRIEEKNVIRKAQKDILLSEEKSDPSRYPTPRYYICRSDTPWVNSDEWTVAFKETTDTTVARTMIATVLPLCGAATTVPVLSLKDDVEDRSSVASVVLANLNSIPFDYVARQKVPGIHINWYVLEQMPIIPFDEIRQTNFGAVCAWDLICKIVLELTYTAHDLAPFARDMGHVDESSGEILDPFEWNDERRFRLKTKIDAVYFHLYGIFDPENREQSIYDIRHIYSTFDTIERREVKNHGRYLSRDLAIAYCNALAAGTPDIEPDL